MKHVRAFVLAPKVEERTGQIMRPQSIREGALQMFSHTRSQSAAMVMPYDVFAATMIQELLACELGVGLGSYFHTCDSFHYYEDESKIVDAITSKEIKVAQPMPKDTSLTQVKSLVAFEQKTPLTQLERNFSLDMTLDAAKSLGAYWEQLALLLVLQSVMPAERGAVMARLQPVYTGIL